MHSHVNLQYLCHFPPASYHMANG